MKKLTLLLFVFSQFVFAQSGEDINTIYIDCDGDSIAVDVSQFPNLLPEMLFEMFDCSDVDEWFWGEDSNYVNNPWEDEDDDFWDFDSTDVNNPWDEEELAFDCINSSSEAFELYFSCMNGDEGACSSLEMLCGGEEEEEEWSWGEGENMGTLFDAISSITVTENELVLVLEANYLIVSVFDEFGFEFLPSFLDGYLVFGPFVINELYDVIIENMDGFQVLWGLFKPMASGLELIQEGIVSATDNNFGDMFHLNQMISIDEVHQDLKVYNTQYYDLMGRKVSNPSKGLYIEVQTTNIDKISTKRFILK